MISLLRAELRRLRSRRLVRILAVLAVLAILIIEGRAFFVSDRNLAAAQRRAAAEAQRYHDQAGDFGIQVRKCEEAKARGEIPPDAICEPPTEQPPAAAFYHDPRLHVRKVINDGARAVAVAVTILAFIIGASFIGAEWNAGTVQALLFWEPRRIRVLLAKGAALVIGMVAFAAALQLLVYGLTMLTGTTRGTTEGVTSGLQQAVLLTALRGMVVVSFGALLGYAVAGLARVTGAALGVAFGYFVVLENLIRGLRPGWQRYLFSENITAILLKKHNVAPAHAKRFDDFEFERFYTLTAGRGLVTLSIYLAILLGVFAVTFQRRDVT